MGIRSTPALTSLPEKRKQMDFPRKGAAANWNWDWNSCIGYRFAGIEPVAIPGYSTRID